MRGGLIQLVLVFQDLEKEIRLLFMAPGVVVNAENVKPVLKHIVMIQRKRQYLAEVVV
jgi:hypothetical protein